MHELFGFLVDQGDLLDQRGAEFFARFQEMTFAPNARQKLLDRGERHACRAQQLDSLDRLLFPRPIFPEAALAALRLEEPLLLVVAQHADAHFASSGQFADLHTGLDSNSAVRFYTQCSQSEGEEHLHGVTLRNLPDTAQRSAGHCV